MAFAISCLGFSFTSATMFHLNVKKMTALNTEEVKKNIIPIHFADNWNDFGGFLYFSNGLWDFTGTNKIEDFTYVVNVSPDGMEYKCARQVKWFYYNAERGERLWPIDKETWSGVDSIKTLDTKGGIFTRCESEWFLKALNDCRDAAKNGGENYDECEKLARKWHEWDSYWYYWMVEQTYPKDSDQNFSLVAWVDYNTSTNFVTIADNTKLVPTFIRFDNKYPAGFIYDPNWWVGLVWCKVKSEYLADDSIKTILNHVTAPDYLDKIFKINGTELEYSLEDVKVDCSDTVRDPLLGIVIEWIVWLGERGGISNLNIVWNEMDTKMQYFSTANINEWTLINYAKKKAEIMCRWKWDNYSSSDSVICKTKDGGVSADGKTYIIKWHDVSISPINGSNPMSANYYDVFVMDGNLIINESNTTDKYVFTTQGFISDMTPATFSGKVAGSTNYAWKEAAVASFIKWNFIVSGKIKGSSDIDRAKWWDWDKLQNKYFIYWKITTTDDFGSLLDTFQWRCLNWIATDWTYCPRSFKENWKYVWLNPYEAASLVVIDQNYPSNLFN